MAEASEKQIASWATEDTLSRLVDLTQTGVQVGKGTGKALEKNHDKLRGILKGFVQQAIVGGASFETKIKKMALASIEKFADFVASLPIIGPIFAAAAVALAALTKVVLQALSGFTDLYDTGIGLNGSFINLMRISGKYNIGLLDLVEVLKGHSESISKMSTLNGFGADAFGELSKAVREQIEEMDYFGLTIAETNEMLGDYLDTQALAGQLQQIDVAKRKISIASYIEEITRLSHFTGKRRKQVQAEVEEVARKKSIALALAAMPEEMRQGMIEMLGVATAYGPTAIAMAEDAIRTGTIGLTEASAYGASLMPEMAKDIMKWVQTIRAGEKVTTEMTGDFIGKRNLESKLFIKTHGQNLSYLASVNEGMAGVAEFHLRSKDLSKKKYLTDLKFQDSLTGLYQRLDHLQQKFVSRFMEIATTFMQIMIDSKIIDGIFGNIDTALTNFTKWLETIVNEESMTKGLKNLSALFSGFDIENPFKGIINVIENIFDKIANSIVKSFEYYIDVAIGKMTKGLLGTELNRSEWNKEQDTAEMAAAHAADRKAREERRLKEGFSIENSLFGQLLGLKGGRSVEGMAKGGIARVPSIFGEAGPEVAIPLPDGSRIPVAEVKRSAAEMKTFEDIRSLLEDIKDRAEFQANESQTQSNTLKQIERKTGINANSIF